MLTVVALHMKRTRKRARRKALRRFRRRLFAQYGGMVAQKVYNDNRDAARAREAKRCSRRKSG